MHNTKITPKQATFLVLACTLSSVHVFLPNELAQYTGRDAWISALLAPFIGCLIFFMVIKLGLLLPNHSLAGINKKLLGRYFGGLITCIYITSFLVLCIRNLIQFGLIMSVAFKPESVPYIWHLIVLIPALYVSFLGISVPARMNEVILPMGLGLIVMLVLLNIPNINLKEYLPVLQYGYKPSLVGTTFIGGHLAYSIIIFALMPLINKKDKLIKCQIIIFGTIIMLSLLVATLSIAILGLKYAETALLPTVSMIRTVDIGFFSRVDAVMMMVWQMGFFIAVAVLLYAAASLTRDLFNFKGYRIILLVYGLVVFIGANIYITNVPQLRQLFLQPLTILLYFLGLAIPLLLYMLAKLKGYPKRE
ncbi:endospore germination permease [Peptococcaceae bacterium 1198_IL3148]